MYGRPRGRISVRLHLCVPQSKCDEMGVQGVKGDEERGGRCK